MRFEEAYEGWNAARLTQAEAAAILGMCERTFRRYVARYEAEGLEGLLDRRLEGMSTRRAPVDEVLALTECLVPLDCIPMRSYPLFVAREKIKLLLAGADAGSPQGERSQSKPASPSAGANRPD